VEKLRVLIADDSVVYRSQIRAALGRFDNVEVVGVASNGRIACDMLSQMKVDLLILDLEMPEMNGLETLLEMAKRDLFHTKVLLFSSFSKRGAEITLEALRLGASDFIAKPGPLSDASQTNLSPAEKIYELLEPKIRNFRPTTATIPAPFNLTDSIPLTPTKKAGLETISPRLIVIGSSTGGPQLLESIFSGLHGPLSCPILIVQHMPPLFTAALAERLQKVSGIPAREARDFDKLENQIYVAPGDFHLVVTRSAGSVLIRTNQEPPENFVRPAVDPLFRSAAKVFGPACLGIVLTGMGSDGTLGAEAIRSVGGGVIIQNKESCAVFGMPGAIFQAGHFDVIATPDEIITLLQNKTRKAA
jgi:two-component system chemotaxis response regulator CheB